MKIKEKIWNIFLDPLMRKIESRLIHLQSQRSMTHDGSCWNSIAILGDSLVFYPEAVVTNYGEKKQITIGNYSHIRGEILVVDKGLFEMGNHTFLGPGSRVWCRAQIRIGSNVLISHDVNIHDSDSHSLNWQERRKESIELFQHGIAPSSIDVAMAPVVIEDDVWIGFGSAVMKGVTIGRGAVVAAGSLVTKDVPPFTLVAGNPARIIRQLIE